MAKPGEENRVSESPFLRIVGVSKSFGGRAILKNLSLEVAQGESVVLVGPSGCGKTTLLRMIAGLETPDAGEIYLDGECVAAGGQNLVPPFVRRIGFVFQDLALWTHLTVEGNLRFVLSSRKVPKTEHAKRIEEMLSLVRMKGFAEKYPGKLSGGEQQRVALARALIGGSRLLLLDEPLSSLDADLRGELRDELIRIQKRLRITTVSVTHDEAEARVLADRIVKLKDGEIESITIVKPEIR
ncbi:MAG: ABC transporter ATP-binding protein [Acidobacteria bacterium]|nr:ABC transporter ATP-binding protein [Acidobacteriota bacterium]